MSKELNEALMPRIFDATSNGAGSCSNETNVLQIAEDGLSSTPWVSPDRSEAPTAHVNNTTASASVALLMQSRVVRMRNSDRRELQERLENMSGLFMLASIGATISIARIRMSWEKSEAP